LRKPVLLHIVLDTEVIESILCFPSDTIYIEDLCAEEFRSSKGVIFDISRKWLKKNNLKLNGINWSIFPFEDDLENIKKYNLLCKSYLNETIDFAKNPFRENFFLQLKYYLLTNLLQNYNNIGIHKGQFSSKNEIRSDVLEFYIGLKNEYIRDIDFCIYSVPSFTTLLLNDFLSKYVGGNENNIPEAFRYALNWENKLYRNNLLFGYLQYSINTFTKGSITIEKINEMHELFKANCDDLILKNQIRLLMNKINKHD
jgi:hypothetical protein